MTTYRGVFKKLRRLYRERWSRPWPFDDEYLQELWLEAKGDRQQARGKMPDVYEEALELMRETHEFEPCS